MLLKQMGHSSRHRSLLRILRSRLRRSFDHSLLEAIKTLFIIIFPSDQFFVLILGISDNNFQIDLTI